MPHHMMNQMSTSVMGTPTTNGAVSQAKNRAAMQAMTDGMQTGTPRMSGEQMQGMMSMDMSGEAMAEQDRNIAPNASSVPNFPQDGYMEGPMMNMEHTAMLQRPENFGLRAGWSSSMQGMMTFVRVLPPDLYEAVIAKMRDAKRADDPYASLLRADRRTA